MTPHEASNNRTMPPRRRRQDGISTGLVLGLVALLLVAGTGYATFVGMNGFCGAHYLPYDAELATAPYVQDVSSTAATVMWRTPDETDGQVAFGPRGALDRIADGDVANIHEVRLTGLEPDTEYAYQVTSGDTSFPVHTFRTAPGPEGQVTAIVLGDSGSGNEAQLELAGVMEGMQADLVLHAGDVVYKRGAECHYDERFYGPYRELIGSVPVYPVLGNHDVRTDNGQPWLDAFAPPAGTSGTERYYSFDFGPMHIAALDSELYYGDDALTTEAQKAWLRDDLASTDRPWKVVLIHRPPYSSSPYHGPDQQILDDLVHIFEEEGVDVVFTAHEHVYERLVPINGITYFVTGGGGGNLREAGESELTAVTALRHHVLRVVVGPERMVIEAVGVDGEVFDRVEISNSSDGS